MSFLLHGILDLRSFKNLVSLSPVVIPPSQFREIFPLAITCLLTQSYHYPSITGLASSALFLFHIRSVLIPDEIEPLLHHIPGEIMP